MADMRNKILVLICDGMGDRLTNGYTPLEKAHKPNFDYLASQGILGIMDPIAPGIKPGSDTSHLAILGYDPYKYYTGRGPFEAIGIGMEVKGGDIAFRCNFATSTPKLVIKDRRAGRISEGTSLLAETVNNLEIDNIKIMFKESVEHRGALVLRGEGLSPHISDTDPHRDESSVLEAKPRDNSLEAIKTASIINKFTRLSYHLLSSHPVNKERQQKGENPANIILSRGAGLVPHLPSFEEKYHLRGAFVAEVGLIKGIARLVGLYAPDFPFATGSYDTDMKQMILTALKLLEEYNIVFVNIKTCDLSSHDRNFEMKVRVIERIDEAITPLKDFKGTLVITADHSSPISVGDHSGDPVPLLITGDVRKDIVNTFSERAAARGGLNRIRGIDLMPTILDLAGYAEKFGA
ncbi:MAG: 2,3-bisphosphoglycerate-independent phosphoglycerate mutase [candidate division WS2 bacterium]|nr:2,3-bisphosphoglycerate-independent phosphoglycerate mutase [Candidatus Lithacetigena glycinireducens]